MPERNYDYITQEEIAKVYAIKSKKKIKFGEMPENFGIKVNYWSKVLNGKRPFPKGTKELFDEWISQFDIDEIENDIHRNCIIPDRVIFEDNAGKQFEIDIPSTVMSESRYRRSTEANRGSLLQEYGVIPSGCKFIGSAYSPSNFITTEEYSKAMRLILNKGVNSKDIAELLDMWPQYWSKVLHGNSPIDEESRKKLHQIFDSYEV